MPAYFESGAFARKPAWHREGTVLDQDYLNKDEALEHGGLAGWNVHKQPVFTLIDGCPVEIPGRFAVVRGKDSKVFDCTVGSKYTVIQNEEAFEVVEALVGGGAQYDAAISIHGGSVVALSLKLDRILDLPDSKVETFINLWNSHDGSYALTAAESNVRIVCANTFAMAERGAKTKFAIRHTRNYADKVDEARRILGFAQVAADRTEKRALELYAAKRTQADWREFLNRLAPIPAQEGRGKTIAENAQAAINGIYHGDDYGQSEIRGTAWGFFQAVNAYDNHLVGGRGTKRSSVEENRFVRLVIDQGGLTSKALALVS